MPGAGLFLQPPYASLRAENPFHGNRSKQTSPASTVTHESALQNRQLCSLSCALQLSQLRQDTGPSESLLRCPQPHCLHPLCSVQVLPPSLGLSKYNSCCVYTRASVQIPRPQVIGRITRVYKPSTGVGDSRSQQSASLAEW